MVVITLAHTGKTKQTHISPFDCKQTNIEYFTLDKYLNIAKRCIRAFCNKSVSYSMLKNEDAISFVAEELIIGTAKFNNNGSLYGYLGMRAKWAIKRWLLLERQSIKHDSLDFIPDGYRSSMYNYIIDKKAKDPTVNDEQNYYDNVEIMRSIVSPRQEECLSMYLLDGMNKTGIAKKLGITIEAVRQNIIKGLEKLHKEIAIEV